MKQKPQDKERINILKNIEELQDHLKSRNTVVRKLIKDLNGFDSSTIKNQKEQ